jgi:hypothetical protein
MFEHYFFLKLGKEKLPDMKDRLDFEYSNKQVTAHGGLAIVKRFLDKTGIAHIQYTSMMIFKNIFSILIISSILKQF